MKNDIFAKARAGTKEADTKRAAKGSELPSLGNTEAKTLADTFVRSEFLKALIAALSDDAKSRLGAVVLKHLVNAGKTLQSKPGSVRILTPVGQVSAVVSTRGSNRPVDDATLAAFDKYAIGTTPITTSKDTYAFNNNALAVPAIQQKIASLLADPELIRLLHGHGIEGDLLEFTVGSTQRVISDQSIIDLMLSATDGEMKRLLPDDQAREAELTRLFCFMIDLKIESKTKPEKTTQLELAKEVLDLFEDADGELVGKPVD